MTTDAERFWDSQAPRGSVVMQPLTDPRLWGRPVTDERYLLVSES